MGFTRPPASNFSFDLIRKVHRLSDRRPRQRNGHGVGNPKEGVLAETKGQRVRVYDRPEFLEEVANKFPESLRWPNYGLPPHGTFCSLVI